MALRPSRRALAPVAAVLGLCCIAVALQLHRGPASDELVSRGCDRLCQARTLIVRAKEALDNKAAAELMLLRNGRHVHAALLVKKPVHGKAREQDLAMLPSTGPAKVAVAPAPPGKGAGAASAKQQVAAAKLSTASLTKKDLNQFVDETLRRERAIVAGAPGVAASAGKARPEAAAKTGLAHHPTWYDTHSGWYAGGYGGGHWHHNEWCYDNPRWHGPFGDPCVAYATGGDRQFWCEWDGAGADNACPRSCGTCSWRSYYKDDTDRERKEHLLHEHFDPQSGPPEPADVAKEAQQQQRPATQADKVGPHEPKRIATRRSMTGALIQEVSEMKHRLMQVAKATRAVAKEVALSRTSNHHLSSGQAAADLANFYSTEKKQTADKKSGDAESDSSALADLLNFFNSEPGGAAAGKGSRLAALRAKVLGRSGSKAKPAGRKGTSPQQDAGAAPQIVAGRTSAEKRLEADKAAAAKRAAAAHRLSSAAAARDIAGYWGKFEAKAKSLKGKKHAGGGMTAEAAQHDMDEFLSEMVAKARVAHRATEAAAEARRAAAKSATEAVPVRHLTDAQARKEFESWWGRDMAAHGGAAAAAAAAGAAGTEKGVGKAKAAAGSGAGGAAQQQVKGKSKGLATFSAASAAKELENFWDEVFPTPKRSGREHRGRDDDRHDGADARRDEARAGKEVEGKSGVGRARREEEEREDDVRSLGLPSGREEAVKISRAHRTSSAASRHNLDDYFGKMLRRDNIAAAKQRLKEHPSRPAAAAAAAAAPQAAPPQALAPTPGYGYPQQYPGQYAMYGQGVPMQAGPAGYAQPEQPQMQAAAGAQVPPAPWPRTSLLDPMQAAFGAAYDGFLAAVDAEAKAGQGQMMGGMQQVQPEQVAASPPPAPPVGMALGEMQEPAPHGPSGVAPASSWAWSGSAPSPAPFKA